MVGVRGFEPPAPAPKKVPPKSERAACVAHRRCAACAERIRTEPAQRRLRCEGSAASTSADQRSDAVKLLKRRGGDLNLGKPSGPDEERVTFEDISADDVNDRTLKGVRASRLA